MFNGDQEVDGQFHAYDETFAKLGPRAFADLPIHSSNDSPTAQSA